MKGCARPNAWVYDQKRFRKGYEMTYLTEEKMMRSKSPAIYQLCHRFDQALLTILWNNKLNYNFSTIFVGKDEQDIRFANLVRSHENSLSGGDDWKYIKIAPNGTVISNTIDKSKFHNKDKIVTDLSKMRIEGWSFGGSKMNTKKSRGSFQFPKI